MGVKTIHPYRRMACRNLFREVAALIMQCGQVFWLPAFPNSCAFPSLRTVTFFAGFVTGYSSASATDSHRLPLARLSIC